MFINTRQGKKDKGGLQSSGGDKYWQILIIFFMLVNLKIYLRRGEGGYKYKSISITVLLSIICKYIWGEGKEDTNMGKH